MSKNPSNPSQNDTLFGCSEISTLDVLIFLKRDWRLIGFMGLVGFVVAGAYLLISPSRFEATAQIAMAQIGIAGNNNGINPLGVAIEEPALLISRLSSPMSFTPQVIETCGYQNESGAALSLSQSIKLTIPKGVVNVVDLKTFGPTARVAKECALALFSLIKATQTEILAPYIEEAKSRLADDEMRLEKARNLVAKDDQSSRAMSAGYLATRDEIRYLVDEIAALKNIIIFNQNRATRLVAPVYVGDMPIAPKKRQVFIAGLLGGLFFGLFLVLVRQGFIKLKLNSLKRVCT